MAYRMGSGPALRDLAGWKPVDCPGHLDTRLRSWTEWFVEL